ncbi:MAG: NADH-quinone oxidoreductase subunit NuoH [Actinobacteria bacterium]|nr:NADH-quinone oxidoreductase subunit NuoH [Actinomycetota bacterium]
MDGWDWLIVLVKSLAIMILFLLSPLILVLVERWVLGRLQSRVGPNRVGWGGTLQTLADGLKLGFKEDLIPTGADKAVFWFGPIFMVIPAMAAWAIVPLGPKVDIGREVQLWAADLNVGLLYFLAMGSLGVYGVVMSGWSSNSKYASFGALRSSAQVVSYELVMGLGALAAVLYAGTLNVAEIVERQRELWFVVPQVVGFLLFFIAGVAETNRAPFDLPEAETELVAGYHVEYSGMRFAMFFIAEYANMLLVSAVATTLFLGGWNGWTIPGMEGLCGVFWFFFKATVLLFVFILMRATLPRFRYDQLMSFCWKLLLPVGVANLILAAGLRVAWS